MTETVKETEALEATEIMTMNILKNAIIMKIIKAMVIMETVQNAKNAFVALMIVNIVKI
jgi:hypothetical protein